MWAITLPTKIKSVIRSIRFKFILAYLLIIILAFAAIGVASIQLVGEHLYTLAGKEDLSRISFIAPGIGDALEKNDEKRAYDLCLTTAEAYGARVLVLDDGSTVFHDSASVLNGSRYTADAFRDTDGKAGAYATVKTEQAGAIAEGMDCKRVIFVRVGTENGYTVCAAFGADHVMEDLRTVTNKLLFAAIAVIVTSALLGFLITRSYTRPVKDLSEAIASLSAGDFSVRVKEEGNNELTDLSRAFNEMTGRMEMLDRSRNQFVSNASHELKTPLATIKIMVQTLLYQEVYDEAMSKEFLGDVDREIDRLNAVVSDLLTLVGMDSGESKLNMEEFSLSEMLVQDVKRLSPLARVRGIEMELNVAPSIDFCGDRIKLDQVFYNLIDNAIKYTPRGESVSVELVQRNKNAYIRVKDTGIGIPEADQKHIFDRFYRVDKARSRETGGTGLGLSIAKQIILAHNGTISVSSKPDKGSVFTVVLPLGGKPAGRQGA